MFTNYVMIVLVLSILSMLFTAYAVNEDNDKKALCFVWGLIGIMFTYVIYVGILYDKPQTIGLFSSMETIIAVTILFYSTLTIFSIVMLCKNCKKHSKYQYYINILNSVLVLVYTYRICLLLG